MRHATSLLALLCALSVGSAQVAAQGRGAGQAKKIDNPSAMTPKAPKAPKTTTTTAPKTTKAPQTTKTTTTTATKTPKATKASPQSMAATTKVKGNPHNTTTTAAAPTTTVVTPQTPTTTRVKNPKLEARLASLLKLPQGTDITPLSAGFKNWGQFVAAAHVSNNLGIDFNQLKTAMTGLVPGATPTDPWVPSPTPTGTLSLGQAVQSLKGTATTPATTTIIQTEVKKAEDAANTELRRTRAGN